MRSSSGERATTPTPLPDRLRRSRQSGSDIPALLDRVKPGQWSWLTDRMSDENDLYWIDHAAREIALLYPGWTVESTLLPLPEAEDVPEGAVI